MPFPLSKNNHYACVSYSQEYSLAESLGSPERFNLRACSTRECLKKGNKVAIKADVYMKSSWHVEITLLRTSLGGFMSWLTPRDTNTLPVERKLVNLVWKHTLTPMVLLSLPAERARVFSIYLPLKIPQASFF